MKRWQSNNLKLFIDVPYLPVKARRQVLKPEMVNLLSPGIEKGESVFFIFLINRPMVLSGGQRSQWDYILGRHKACPLNGYSIIGPYFYQGLVWGIDQYVKFKMVSYQFAFYYALRGSKM